MNEEKGQFLKQAILIAITTILTPIGSIISWLQIFNQSKEKKEYLLFDIVPIETITAPLGIIGVSFPIWFTIYCYFIIPRNNSNTDTDSLFQGGMIFWLVLGGLLWIRKTGPQWLKRVLKINKTPFISKLILRTIGLVYIVATLSGYTQKAMLFLLGSS